MAHDLLTEKAILLRDTLSALEHSLEKQEAPTFADRPLLQQVEEACKMCVALGGQWMEEHHQTSTKNEFILFQKLVENQVIDRALGKRLLSFMAFGKLIRKASLIKGKNIHLKLTSRHLQDFHTFTQKVLLA